MSGSGVTAIFTKPWFVVSVVFGCFAVITPRILIPIVKQLFGLNEPTNLNTNNNNFYDRRGGQMPPVMQKSDSGSSNSGGEMHRGPTPHFQKPQQDQQGSSSMSRSILVFILPVYAIGIAAYMAYTLFKVYSKKSDKENEEQKISDEFANYNFNDIKWDPFNKKFITENEFMPENEYTNLDEDYVQFLKQKRRKGGDNSTTANIEELKAANTIDDSATRTGDLNKVLSVMKVSLNNINKRLQVAEKKGGPMDDTDLQNLRLQLANTELQMVKILQAMDTMSLTEDKNDEFDGNTIKKIDKTRRKHHHKLSTSNSNSSSPTSSESSSSSSSLSDSEEERRKKKKKNRKRKKNKKRNLLKAQQQQQKKIDSTNSSEVELEENRIRKKELNHNDDNDDIEENEL